MNHSRIHRVLLLSTVLLPIVSGPATRVEAGKVKVFILAGQSNMEGKGQVETGNGNVSGAIGSLRYQVNNDPDDYGHLVTSRGNWVVRDDVWIYSTTDGGEKGNLTVGFGSGAAIGPELGFGHVIGDLYEDQVLLIKTAWGGKSLAVDFRPPRRGSPGIGFYYTEMLNTVDFVLENIATEFPDYADQGYEIIGFGWHQGWNDRVNQTHNDEYEVNLFTFIRDIRSRRNGLGVTDLPFVVAETGMTGPTETHPRALSLMAAQAAVTDFVKYPEFEGNVAFVGTRDFWRPAAESPKDEGYHWNQNGETYYLIGDGMGRAMAALLFEPRITEFETLGTGEIVFTANVATSALTVQRSNDLAPDSFVDVPSTADGNTLTVTGQDLDPDGDGAAYFRVRW